MAFGRRSGKDDSEDTSAATPGDDVEAAAEPDDNEEVEGPFDIDDFDDPAVAELARLDLGSVLIPMPEGDRCPERGVGRHIQRSFHHRRLCRTQDGRAVA